MGIRQWDILNQESEYTQALARETGLPTLLCAVLFARGYTTMEAINSFLEQEWELCDPYRLKDMDKAVARIRAAVAAGEQIAVYGDYDCDGITATSLLVSYLQSAGARVFYYVPNRDKEGYGMNKGAVDSLADMGARLIITVDNGISAHEEIAYAATRGIDVVVTDHHTPRETLPAAVAVVNPRRRDCESPCKELAGVGVAFKLICALEEAEGTELLEYYSELVALGTVADVVPLVGENRVMVACGLRHIRETESPGVSALLDVGGLAGKPLGGDDLAFCLVPRLNACGRMGSVDDAIELLLTDDPGYAAELASKIASLNEQRRKAEESILAEAEGIIAATPQLLEERILIIGGKSWHHGVVGIVSAKMMEKYSMPCILFSIDNGEARGSGRSMEGFSLIEAISACSGDLTRYGGHTLAVGLTLPEEKLEDFCRQIQLYAVQHCAQMPPQRLPIDCMVSPRDLTVEAVRSLSRMEPLGEAMRAPLFLLRGLSITGIYPTSDKKHIRIRFSDDGNSFGAVYFRMAATDFPYMAGDVVDVVASADVSEYNGKTQVSVKIRDVRLHNVRQEEIFEAKGFYERNRRGEPQSGDARERMIPSREELAAVYRYLKRAGEYRFGVEELYFRLRHVVSGFDRLLVALDIFEELGLVCRGEKAAGRGLRVVDSAQKVDIESSQILAKLRRGSLVKNGA